MNWTACIVDLTKKNECNLISKQKQCALDFQMPLANSKSSGMSSDTKGDLFHHLPEANHFLFL